jgi:mannose-6-phosphate isomerase-like protein (cupin superfamily)
VPLLDLKEYRKGKRNEKTVQEESFRNWVIFMHVTNAQRLHQIIHILHANRQWAFVWTRRHRSENYFLLNGCIIFETPQTKN